MSLTPCLRAWLCAGLLATAACSSQGKEPSGGAAQRRAPAPSSHRTSDTGSRYLPTAEPMGAIPAESDPLRTWAQAPPPQTGGFPPPTPPQGR